jgi:hypothetical protein
MVLLTVRSYKVLQLNVVNVGNVVNEVACVVCMQLHLLLPVSFHTTALVLALKNLISSHPIHRSLANWF